MLNHKSIALQLDKDDPLALWRQEFHIPKTPQGSDGIYLCGNSLGLQPKATAKALEQELSDWKNLAVEGHFLAKNPWLPYHESLSLPMANIVGALPSEVVMMNSLTVNLHLMMVSFYRPVGKRFKILIESQAFSSDRYAVVSQLKFHGYDENALLEISPREGESNIRHEDLVRLIIEQGPNLALVLIGGVNYYTGQCFDMKDITRLAHEQGSLVGFDLAHAVGNVALQLHDWDVDFACWCSYKYLNSGPGSLAGCFVHERFAHDETRPRFCGWWGHDKDQRFQMHKDFKPIVGVQGWQLSNPSILSLAAVKASLEIFEHVGMSALISKSQKLTGFLESLLDEVALKSKIPFKMITPRSPTERGCQISITMNCDRHQARSVFEALSKQHVICDWREPNCLRVAAVPLYNSFQDVLGFVESFARQTSFET